jgi:predicted SAM-dependent methyltransferase
MKCISYIDKYFIRTKNKTCYMFASIKRYFKKEKRIASFLDTDLIQTTSSRVNLGCGNKYHDAWDNFDLTPAGEGVRFLDLTGAIKISSGAYEFCYSSHVLEHLSRSDAPRFLSEIFRILKPGGIVRIVVPDLEGIVRGYLCELDAVISGKQEAVPRHQWMTIELLDQITRTFSGGYMGRLWHSRPLFSRELIEKRLGKEASQWLNEADKNFISGEIPLTNEQVFQVPNTLTENEVVFRNCGEVHKWMYDRISLRALLDEAGFHDLRVCRATESRIPNFNSYLLDSDENGKTRKPDSLFMEGRK